MEEVRRVVHLAALHEGLHEGLLVVRLVGLQVVHPVEVPLDEVHLVVVHLDEEALSVEMEFSLLASFVSQLHRYFTHKPVEQQDIPMNVEKLV